MQIWQDESNNEKALICPALFAKNYTRTFRHKNGTKHNGYLYKITHERYMYIRYNKNIAK